jgi:hypothetical protein
MVIHYAGQGEIIPALAAKAQREPVTVAVHFWRLLQRANPTYSARTSSHLGDIVVTASYQTIQTEPGKAMSFRLSTERFAVV